MDGPAVVAILGAVFTLFGAALLYWGVREEKQYYESMARRPDAREFVTRFPMRPEPGGLKAGGVIGIAVGLVLFVLALVLWLTAS